MYADGKSDDFVVLSTRANKAATAVAESVEERESPKGDVAGDGGPYRDPHGMTESRCMRVRAPRHFVHMIL